MFITLTIDTTQKRKVRAQKLKVKASKNWRGAMNAKKRSLHHKIAAWKRSLRSGYYKMDGQVAVF